MTTQIDGVLNPTLVERLEQFEKHQLDEGDEYGAEVLHHAIDALQQANEGIDKLERLLIYAGGILGHGTPGRAWMDWLMRVQGVMGMKFVKGRFTEDDHAIPFSVLEDMVEDLSRVPRHRMEAE